MTYILVRWKHEHADSPVLLYSELDGERWEVRKVEVFADGRRGWASTDHEEGGTRLGQVPVPDLETIAAASDSHDGFEPVEISAAEFEVVWGRATRRS